MSTQRRCASLGQRLSGHKAIPGGGKGVAVTTVREQQRTERGNSTLTSRTGNGIAIQALEQTRVRPMSSSKSAARNTGAMVSPPTPPSPRKQIPLYSVAGDDIDTAGRRTGQQVTSPEMASSRVVTAVERTSGFADAIDVPGLLAAMRDHAEAVNGGDLKRCEAMLMNQATALQSLFVRLIERGLAQDSLPQYEAHMRLALKAQAQSRASLEALANIRNGPAIFARQANVAAGAPLQVNNGSPPRSRVEN